MERDRRLSEPERRLVSVHCWYNGAAAIADVFLSLYLFESAGIASLAKFCIANFVSLSFGFVVVGYMLRRMSTRLLMRLGIVGYAIVALAVVGLGGKASALVLLMGALKGVAESLYWAAANMNEYVVTRIQTRNLYQGRLALGRGLTSATAPFLAGIAISVGSWFWSHTFGYAVAFALLALVMCIALTKTRGLGDYGGLNFRLRHLRERAPAGWGWVLATRFVMGISVNSLPVLVSIMLIRVVGNEATVGVVNAVMTISAGLMAVLAGVVLQRYRHTYWIGSLLVPVGLIGFAFEPNWVGIGLLVLIASAFDPFVKNRGWSIAYDVVDVGGTMWRDTYHRALDVELLLNAGRVVGFGAILMLSEHLALADLLKVSMVVIGASYLLMAVGVSRVAAIVNSNAQEPTASVAVQRAA